MPRDVIDRRELAPIERDRLKVVLDKLNGLTGPGTEFPTQLSKLQRALDGTTGKKACSLRLTRSSVPPHYMTAGVSLHTHPVIRLSR